MNKTFARILYSGFLLFTVYHIFIAHDVMTAASNLGIALIFDPFDQNVRWNDRPIWQRAWLIVHLIVMFSLFGYAIFQS